MRPLLALLVLAIPSSVAGAGLPEYLEGQRYTYSEEACLGEAESSSEEETTILSTLEVNEAGIFAYEFGCTFLEFWPGDGESDTPFIQTVLASCGDDSGITRPDVISLVFNTEEPQSVTVTSQNEYVMGQTFISRTYPICRSE
jgi:hypothetical protein